MSYGSGDFRQLVVMQASDFERVYDVEPVTSGFGDFYSSNALGSTQTLKHIVSKGETLGTIAARYYGTSSRYLEIYNANLGLMQKLGPNVLEIGWTLTIPNVTVEQAAKVEVAKIEGKIASPTTQDCSFCGMKKYLLIGALLIGAFILYKKSKEK